MREGHIEFPLGTLAVITEVKAVPNHETEELDGCVTMVHMTTLPIAQAFGMHLGKLMPSDRSDEHENLYQMARRIAADRLAMTQAMEHAIEETLGNGDSPDGKDGYDAALGALLKDCDALAALIKEDK